MQYLDKTLPTAAENLALDEALLMRAEEDGTSEILRLWEWPAPVVVLGAGCKIAEDVNENACLRDSVSILRRSSGGGTVLLDSGCMCYSLVLSMKQNPELLDIRASFRHILERVRDALTAVQPGVDSNGTSDLVIGTRKFSGNSQHRKRRMILHHGTLLYKMDLNRVEDYLRLPARQPEYRHNRNHGEFLRNLPATAEVLRECLRAGRPKRCADWSTRNTDDRSGCGGAERS
jgi:lipoate-protein ligase A